MVIGFANEVARNTNLLFWGENYDRPLEFGSQVAFGVWKCTPDSPKIPWLSNLLFKRVRHFCTVASLCEGIVGGPVCIRIRRFFWVGAGLHCAHVHVHSSHSFAATYIIQISWSTCPKRHVVSWWLSWFRSRTSSHIVFEICRNYTWGVRRPHGPRQRRRHQITSTRAQRFCGWVLRRASMWALMLGSLQVCQCQVQAFQVSAQVRCHLAAVFPHIDGHPMVTLRRSNIAKLLAGKSMITPYLLMIFEK